VSHLKSLKCIIKLHPISRLKPSPLHTHKQTHTEVRTNAKVITIRKKCVAKESFVIDISQEGLLVVAVVISVVHSH
jgi:hypothetical protein